MADKTHIEWTDATWNIVTGCEVVSPGCTNCYAMRLAGTRLKHHPSRAGLTKPSRSGPVWTGEVRFNAEWLDQPLRWRKPRRIFVAAHGDLFHENVPDAVLDQVFAVMALAPQHQFQVLTKRPERMREFVLHSNPRICVEAFSRVLLERQHSRVSQLGGGVMMTGDIPHLRDWPLPNVWLGVSVEGQQRADERIPPLLGTPAALRFVSVEPLLGPVDLSPWLRTVSGRLGDAPNSRLAPPINARFGNALDWVIVGGESQAGARPMHPDWARNLRDQCAAAGVAFFFKQWGEWAPLVGALDWWEVDDDPEISTIDHREWEGGSWSEPFRPMWCDWTDGNRDQEQCVARLGKKAAGRVLDGRTHDEVPGC